MALVVENGTGLATAESYLAVADFKTHATARGLAWAGRTDAQIEQALRRATIYIDGRYGDRWPGYRLTSRTQALDWPRTLVVDSDGYDVASNAVPRELVAATVEVAWRELTTPGSLTPDYVQSERVVSESVGPISTTYSDKGSAADVRPVVTIVDELLSNLLLQSGGSVRTLLRA